jgi:hypothetical protein
MKKDYLARIKTFIVDDLQDIDEIVLGSLQFLSESDIPKLNVGACKRPLVMGSDNAFLTGQIQKRYPSYFKNEIVGYTERGSNIFGQNTRPIVK